jgi:hypothetical protein
MNVVKYVKLKTLSPSNQFQFPCPIFGSVTKIASCFQLDELVMRGQRPAVRKGCQACMKSSKCPIWHIKQHQLQTNADDYYSAEPKVGQLSSAILERIAPIRIQDVHMRDVESDSERQRMMQANEDAKAGVVKKGKAPKNEKTIWDQPVMAKEPAVKINSATDVAAAMTGDMGAAITAELNKAS